MGNVNVRIKPASGSGCGFCDTKESRRFPSPRRGGKARYRRGVRSLCHALRGADDRLGELVLIARAERGREALRAASGAVVVSVKRRTRRRDRGSGGRDREDSSPR